MNANRLLTSILGLALVAAPAGAKPVPILSGKYASNYNQTCQALQDGANPGSTLSGIFITTFNSDTGMVHLQGYNITGPLVVWSGGNGGMSRTALSKDSTFSNDATTATFDGVVYDVNYGTVKNGIAESVLLAGVPYNVSGNCVASIILIRQH